MSNYESNHEMAISDAELRSLTADMADAHADSYPVMQSGVAEWSEVESEKVRRAMSRRGFIVTASTMIAGGLALATVPAAASTRLDARAAATAASTKGVPLDVVVAGLAASLENLAVGAYDAGIRAATAGKLGTVPPAVVTFATTARSQHAQHGQAWNSILTAAGHKAITAPDPVLGPMITQQLGQVHDVVGLAKLALSLEDVAAATYQAGIGSLSSTSAVKVAASIQPVELQHAAILLFALGQYPVPNAFSPTSGARPVSDLKG